MKTLLVFVMSLIPAILYAQVQTGGLTPKGVVDASGATHTLPVKAGLAASKPGTCTPGELYFATDATAGQNLYQCGSANTWTQQLNSGGSGGVGSLYPFTFKITGSATGVLVPSNAPTVEVGGNNPNLIVATLPASCTFKNMYMAIGNGGTVAAAKSIVFTLYTNSTLGSNALIGTASSITCTIAASGNACNDTTHTVAATAPLGWGIQVVSTDTNSLYMTGAIQCQ